MEALKKDGHDLPWASPMDTPINQAERVVSAGKGIGDKKNMKLIENLAKAAGAAVGSSRPVAETLKYVPLSRYVACPARSLPATYTSPAVSRAPPSI